MWLVMSVGFLLEVFAYKKVVGYLNHVNIEYIDKDSYLCWLKIAKPISIGSSGILQAFRGDLYGYDHGTTYNIHVTYIKV